MSRLRAVPRQGLVLLVLVVAAAAGGSSGIAEGDLSRDGGDHPEVAPMKAQAVQWRVLSNA
jgi:hypothetical protein